jgi:hypothetical protein
MPQAPELASGPLPSALDSAMRPLARRLDADKMARLGIRNTMGVAKRYNRLLYGRYQRHRIEQYRHHLAELLEENGRPSGGDHVRMKDGFALDTSMALPHLDDLLRHPCRIQ